VATTFTVARPTTLRHPKNKTRYRSLDKIAADSRVVEIWDEGEDGIWVQLVDGWNWDDVSCVHEWRVRDVLRAFRGIKEGPVL
jgi:hypothetical protein